MPLTTLYNTGTVSVGAGSTTVTGSGTAWNTAGLQAGDDFRASGLTVPIASINSATSITLSRAWPGSALSGANYDIRMVDDGVRSLTASNQLLQALAGGTLTSLGSIAGAANVMPYWSGVGVMSSTALTPLGRTLVGGADAAAMRATLGLVLATGPTDATAGRIPTAGWMGIGAVTPATITDFNAATPGSIQVCTTGTNAPGGVAGPWVVFTLGYSPSAAAQTAYNLSTGYSYERVKASNIWASWRYKLMGGDFGIGGSVPPQVSDLTSAADGGLSWFVENTVTGSPGASPFQVAAIKTGSAAGDLLLSGRITSTLSSFRAWLGTRAAKTGAYGWSEILHQYRILGAVSQSGGVPTGALIERGSNANGEYVRLADGTQICTFALTSSDSADTTWTFPAAFITTPSGISVISSGSTNASPQLAAAGGPSISFNIYNTSNARSARFCRVTAIGRWF